METNVSLTNTVGSDDHCQESESSNPLNINFLR